MSGDLDHRFVNCIKWMCRTVLKYGPNESQEKLHIVKTINDLASNEKARENCTNPLVRNALVCQMPDPLFDKLCDARQFYYMNEQERIEFLKKNVADFKKTLTILNEALDSFETVIETEAQHDLYMLGGYIELFLGPFISNRVEVQKRNNKEEPEEL